MKYTTVYLDTRLSDLDLMAAGMRESKNILTKFSIDFDGILYAVETCWSHTHFIGQFDVQRRELYLNDLIKEKSLGLLTFGHLQADFSQTWWLINTTKLNNLRLV